ncbi:MAG: DRTGG domain-containing protein [Oscillospiraceae bacterium]|nr:DRTGG domain-containing protein [Oscillospiraceae bacterium]
MTVSELCASLAGAERVCGSDAALSREVTGGYCGDLLSWVMGRAQPGQAWVTIMGNANTAAVALLADVSCVILAEGVAPDAQLLSRARAEDLPLFGSAASAFELCAAIGRALRICC